MDRDYVRGLFDWLAPRYEAALGVYSLAQDLRWKWELVRRLRPRRGETALDLACGTGLVYDRLARTLGPESVVGIDLNRAMLSRGRRRDVGRRVVRADSIHLPFRNASFDVVTAGYLLKYVPLGKLSAEVRRVLRPAGRFGGYDFSAPIAGSLTGRAYHWYLHEVLPRFGRVWGREDPRWDELLEFLARVATTSGWETRVAEEFHAAGFDRVQLVPSLGGAIT